MNWVLKILTLLLGVANIIYPLIQGNPDGSEGRKGGIHMIKNQDALSVSLTPNTAPISISTSSTQANTTTETPSDVLKCLEMSHMNNDRKEEALTMLGLQVQATAFKEGALWQVRFGPWPSSTLLPLQELLNKWAGIKAEVCSEKEKEEWDKSK